MMLSEKPADGSGEEALVLAEFARLCRELHWHTAFQTLGEDTLLVMDPEVQAALEKLYGSFRCQTAAPKTLKTLPEGVGRVLCLCRDREWLWMKKARDRWQNISILSLIYDVAPMGVLSAKEFPYEKPNVETTADGVVSPRNWLLTTPGSDSEFLRITLEKNGLASFSPAAGKLISSWVLLSRDFRVLRFAKEALKHARTRADAVHLDLYMVHLIFRHTHLKRKRFFEWVNAGDGHMLYFISRDKARQVALNQMMETADYCSLWDRSAAAVRKLDGQAFSIDLALDRLIDLLVLESRLEVQMQNIDNFKIITLEDLVVVPHEVLKALALFWGMKMPRNWQEIDWRARYAQLPDFVSQLAILREKMLQRFGLDI